MAADYTRVVSLIIQELAAGDAYGTTVSDPRFYDSGIRDAVVEADSFVVGAIIASNSAWKTQLTKTSSTVAHAGSIPAHIGPVVSVVLNGKGADPWPKSEIEWERTNSLSLASIDPHYWIDNDGVLFHNYSGNATVWYYAASYASGSPPTLVSPDAFEEVIASKALAFLINVEGENTAAAAQYDQHWQATMKFLLANEASPQ